METLGDKIKGNKGCYEYVCISCDFKCSKKYSWERHLLTGKHINATECDNLGAIKGKKGQKDIFACEICSKEYQHRQCLWRHKKKCTDHQQNTKQDKESKEKINSIDKDELIMMLLKQNSEIIKEQSEIIKENSELRKEQADIKELILEIVKNGTMNNSHNTTHTNSHNKAFNLQFFLNETCKNAMNITEFVESIKLQLSDFMSMGEVGFVEGISNIIVKNLNSLDETVRPIHCTDQKRETFYVKDENQWEKEEDDRKKLKKMIRSIAYKNEKLMRVYKETYPDYNNSDSKRSDQYSKIMIESMDCKEESREKIIKNISKATTIKTK
jgi:hypothetical protein